MTIKALVVLSGGQDSTTCLFWAVHKYGRENVRAISFDYGQRHEIELEAARRVAKLANVYRETVFTGTRILTGTSPLVDMGEALPQYKNFAAMEVEVGDRVEKTFVPMRNALFIVLAANRAVVYGCTRLVLGVCQQDNANYPDCRQSFIDAMAYATNQALGRSGEDAIAIDTPLMELSKAQSIGLALALPSAYPALAWTHTSYDGLYPPTDKNHANLLRAQGFLEAGVPDPLVIRAWQDDLMELPGTPNYSQAVIDGMVKQLGGPIVASLPEGA